jgi:hypothetical protein
VRAPARTGIELIHSLRTFGPPRCTGARVRLHGVLPVVRRRIRAEGQVDEVLDPLFRFETDPGVWVKARMGPNAGTGSSEIAWCVCMPWW